MVLSAKIFLGIILLIFTLLDVGMIVSLLKPGDERKKMIVWKASSYTLLVIVLEMLINVIYCAVSLQPMKTNTFIHLEITAVIYFIALLYFSRKHGG